MSDEYLSKEEIKKWRSSVEKITLEEYAARLGKKLQETKQTNDLADMLYTHFNPAQTPKDYDVVTKLEKIDLTPKAPSAKGKKASKILDEYNDLGMDDDMLLDDMDDFEEKADKIEIKVEKKVEPKAKPKAETVKEKKTAAKEDAAPKKKPAKEKKAADTKEKKSKTAAKDAGLNAFSELNITFKKPLTDREERVLSHFVEKRGEIVYAKDIAELLDLKRDYIYKYIKNLRAKMSTDVIVNADNGGFKLE